jgi:hypothetical protein
VDVGDVLGVVEMTGPGYVSQALRRLVKRADRLLSLSIGLPESKCSVGSVSPVRGELMMVRNAVHVACADLYVTADDPDSRSNRESAWEFLRCVAPSLLADKAHIEVASSDPNRWGVAVTLPAFTTPYPFSPALAVCIDQAVRGKGEQRHGHGAAFVEQLWVQLAFRHGVGFLTGQSEKKWIEANTSIIATDDERYIHEVAGSINYALMAVLAITYPELLEDGASKAQRSLSAEVWLAGAWPVTQPRTTPETLRWPKSDGMRLDQLLVSLQNMVLHMACALCNRLDKMGVVPPPVSGAVR